MKIRKMIKLPENNELLKIYHPAAGPNWIASYNLAACLNKSFELRINDIYHYLPSVEHDSVVDSNNNLVFAQENKTRVQLEPDVLIKQVVKAQNSAQVPTMNLNCNDEKLLDNKNDNLFYLVTIPTRFFFIKFFPKLYTFFFYCIFSYKFFTGKTFSKPIFKFNI